MLCFNMTLLRFDSFQSVIHQNDLLTVELFAVANPNEIASFRLIGEVELFLEMPIEVVYYFRVNHLPEHVAYDEVHLLLLYSVKANVKQAIAWIREQQQ